MMFGCCCALLAPNASNNSKPHPFVGAALLMFPRGCGFVDVHEYQSIGVTSHRPEADDHGYAAGVVAISRRTGSLCMYRRTAVTSCTQRT